MQKKVVFLFTLFCCTALAVVGHAQKTAWLKGHWTGKAYLSQVDTQFYYLALDVSKVKGENFEGILKTIKPADSSIHFDSEVKGIIKGKKFGMIRTRIIYARNDVQNNWKVVNCNNCKPPEWEYLFEEGRFVIRGAIKNCDKECDWVTELSKDVREFDSSGQEELYALLDNDNKPDKSLFVTASGTNIPAPVTAAVAGTERTPILNAGSIVSSGKAVAMEKTAAALPAIKLVPDPNNEVYIPKQISLTAADSIITAQQRIYTTLKEPNAKFTARKPLLKVNSSSHIAYRTPLIAAGNIELLKRNQKSPIAQRTNKKMTITKPYLELPGTRFTAAKLQAEPSAGITKEAVAIKVLPPAPPLPAGFTERKKNVVRTLEVNTDSVVLRVYDNGVVDGDIVSVIYNGNVVIDQLSLTTRIVEVKIPVDLNGINSLVFHAHNLGQFPPNTAKLEIIYGNKREELTVSSDLTVSSTIDIIRK